MTQAHCSHCGKPIQTGFLCGDCQALRAYQPHLFVNDVQQVNVMDRIRPLLPLAIGAVCVIAAGIGAWTRWPQIQKWSQGSAEASSDPTKTFTKLTQDYANTAKSYMDDKTVAAGNGPATDISIKSNPSIQADQASSLTFNSMTSHSRTGAPRFADIEQQVSDPGNFAAVSKNSLVAFLSNYCADRSAKAGHRVDVSHVMMLPGGCGAVVSFDDLGTIRQGTAQYSPKIGWHWMVSPDARTPVGQG